MNVDELKVELKRADLDVLFLVESGSHIFGWCGPDSDEDVRGVYLDPLEKIISLHPGKDCIVSNPADKIWDVQLFELKKYLGQLTKPNFNMMEWVFSRIVYHDQDIIERMRMIAEEAWCTKLGDHARGWSYSIYKMDWNNPKKCLMALRPLMVYNHLLQTQTWESNINTLSVHSDSELQDLVDSLIECRMSELKTPEKLKDLTNKHYELLKQHSFELETTIDFPRKQSTHAIAQADAMIEDLRLPE